MQLCTVYYISVNCSKCFGWQLHPSSGVHITAIKASGTGETDSATSPEKVWPVSAAVIAVISPPDDGWSYHPKHVQQFTEIYGLQVRTSSYNSNRSPTWFKNFSVYYPDVYLQLNRFWVFSRPSSEAQRLQ